jgi:hypothetical protein
MGTIFHPCKQNDMSLLSKFFRKGGDESNAVIAPEIYGSVHVMRDDINEMEGRPKESFPGSVPDADPSQANNPFLGTAAAAPMPSAGSSPEPVEPTRVERKKLYIFAGFGFLVLITAIFGIYFFLGERGGQQELTTDLPPVSVPAASIPVQESLPVPSQTMFSLSMPNYIQIDPESDAATPDGIFTKLSNTARKVREMNTPDPVEFLIRDMNNNPIAFSRFAYLSKLGIPEDALSLIDESFSIYLVPDESDIRFALALDMKDAEKLMPTVVAGEPSLPSWFGRLLYEPSSRIPATVLFRSGTYGTIATKFAVVDEAKNYSFDYAFVGKKWVIGTSKESFRAALGKIAMEQAK